MGRFGEAIEYWCFGIAGSCRNSSSWRSLTQTNRWLRSMRTFWSVSTASIDSRLPLQYWTNWVYIMKHNKRIYLKMFDSTTITRMFRRVSGIKKSKSPKTMSHTGTLLITLWWCTTRQLSSTFQGSYTQLTIFWIELPMSASVRTISSIYVYVYCSLYFANQIWLGTFPPCGRLRDSRWGLQ